MFLSDPDIIDAIARQEIILDPPAADEDIQSVGIRMGLGRHVLIPFPGQRIDPRRPKAVKHFRWDLREDGPLIFKPGSFAIGATLASVRTSPTLLVFLDTRSGIARYGIQNHLASQVINGTWKKPVHIVLEIVNLGPMEIVISEGMPIGMIYFGQLTRPPSEERQGTSFHVQNGPLFAGPQQDPTPRSRTGLCLARIRRALADWIAP